MILNVIRRFVRLSMKGCFLFEVIDKEMELKILVKKVCKSCYNGIVNKDECEFFIVF